MKNIIILAGGPAKPGRNRHLERFEGEILIDKVISKCAVDNSKIYVLVSHNNPELQQYINEKDNIGLIIPKSDRILDSFKAALFPFGDCILVCGDLIQLRSGDINKFISSPFQSAICRYKIPWGEDIVSKKGSLRRSDIGDCISMISEAHKQYFLGAENLIGCISAFNEFYPNKIPDEYIYNDIGTHLMYSFFRSIWSNKDVNDDRLLGTVYFDHPINTDND
jgi:GTP:adenosylcobinamide-phosphate guanylyltransferase